MLFTCLTMMLNGCAANQSLTINNAWARPAAMGENSAIYFVIANPGSADVLRNATGDIAKSIELHISKMENNVMKMEHQEKVEVPANQNIEFKPGGLHVMLINVNQDLKVGDSFNLTLHFDHAGTKTIQVTVKQP